VRKGSYRVALLSAALFIGSQAGAQSPDDALVGAIVANDLGGAREALAQKADPNARLAYRATPLARAVNTQNREMVRLLLAAGAKPSIADADGVAPLGLGCELGDADIVTQLLDAQADVKAVRPDGTGTLAICARFGSSEAVARMLKAGAPADHVDGKGQTPLMWAAAAGNVDTIKLLLDAGAKVNRVSKAGFTPLFFAIKSNVVPATAMMLAAGADASHRGPERASAAQLAIYQKNYGAAALLVEHGGVDLVERDRNGNQILHGAAMGGDVHLIQMLLARGADPNGLSGKSRITYVTESNAGMAPPRMPPVTPLLRAAFYGHADAMEALLAGGANPGFVAEDGTNVVLSSVRGGLLKPLEIALRVAPNPDVADIDGSTALHYLLNPGLQRKLEPDLEAMIQCFAQHGARVDLADKRGNTARTVIDRTLTEVKVMYFKYFPGDPDGGPVDRAPKVAVVGAAPLTRN
jgi:ankyrin repeat protein